MGEWEWNPSCPPVRPAHRLQSISTISLTSTASKAPNPPAIDVPITSITGRCPRSSRLLRNCGLLPSACSDFSCEPLRRHCWEHWQRKAIAFHYFASEELSPKIYLKSYILSHHPTGRNQSKRLDNESSNQSIPYLSRQGIQPIPSS